MDMESEGLGEGVGLKMFYALCSNPTKTVRFANGEVTV